MLNVKAPISVTAKKQILKFAEGADPEKDAPFEIIDHEETYYGEEAIKLLNEMGVDTNGIN